MEINKYMKKDRPTDSPHRTYCGLQLTFLRSGLRLGSGASRGLGGSRFLSCNRLTGLKASTSNSGTPLRPPRAADSWDKFGNGCKQEINDNLSFL